MPQRQLNIRSDEAAALAASLARRLNATTTDVVLKALRSLDERMAVRDADGMTASQRRRYEAIRAAAREIAAHVPPDMPADHDWLYGENGLPT